MYAQLQRFDPHIRWVPMFVRGVHMGSETTSYNRKSGGQKAGYAESKAPYAC